MCNQMCGSTQVRVDRRAGALALAPPHMAIAAACSFPSSLGPSVRIADEQGARTRSSTGRTGRGRFSWCVQTIQAAVSDVIQAIDTHSHCQHRWLTKSNKFGELLKNFSQWN